MRKMLTNNLGLKLISLAIGFVIWLVIMNAQDPVITNKFTLDVSIENADILAEQDKTYEIVSGDTITITVSGKTSVVQNLKSSDFIAKADMSKLSITNAVPVEVSVTKSASQITIDTNNAMLNVEIENVVSKDFKINFNTVGTEGEGYHVGAISGVPNIVTVTGSESRVGKVAKALVTVNIAGVTDDLSLNEKIHLVDENGNELLLDKYTLSSSYVAVTVDVLKTKVVPVYLEFEGTAKNGYMVTSTSYEPREVIIAGEYADLRGVNEINLGTYTYSDLSESENIQLSIAEQLPENIQLVENEANGMVAAKIEVEKIAEKEFTFDESNINFSGANNLYTYGFTESSNKIVLVGPESVINSLTDETLTLNASVNTLGVGKHYVELKVEGDNNISIKKKVSIPVLVSKK